MPGHPITSVAVIGAGTMGRGIAQVAAQSGLRVRLFDASADVLGRAIESAHGGIARLVGKGELAADAGQRARELLLPAGSVEEAAAGADLVVEAVPETPELKREVFQTLEPALSEGAILATNTSSIPIRKLAASLRRPERFLGLHFFNPVPRMRLLEIVVGAETSPDVVESARELASRLGKEAILVRDSPGFATSRLGLAIGLEAMRMLEEGVASAEDIDRAMELGYAHPMGPLRLTDLVGLDVRLHIAEELARELGPRFEPPRVLRAKVEAGELGKKTGRGFHVWPREGRT